MSEKVLQERAVQIFRQRGFVVRNTVSVNEPDIAVMSHNLSFLIEFKLKGKQYNLSDGQKNKIFEYCSQVPIIVWDFSIHEPTNFNIIQLLEFIHFTKSNKEVIPLLGLIIYNDAESKTWEYINDKKEIKEYLKL